MSFDVGIRFKIICKALFGTIIYLLMHSVTFLKICYYSRQWDLIWCNDTTYK